MALLNDADRIEVWREMIANPIPGEVWSLISPDLRAAVDGLDGWLDANAGSANSAIPQPARGALSVKQKARLLQYVIARRYLRTGV